MIWAVDLQGVLGTLHLAMSFEVSDNLLTVIGPNGAGKSTLLRAIAGAPLPLTGTISMGSRVLLDSAVGIDVRPHERRVGYVPQGYGLFPHLNVVANVAFGCGRGSAATDRARDALARFDAQHLMHRFPQALSGGEQQRVALARAIAPDPDALLLDEPLAALDPELRGRMRGRLGRHLRDLGRPAIVATHDARDLEALGGTVLVVEAGRVVQVGPVEAVRGHPGSPFVRGFFDVARSAQGGPRRASNERA
jgi:molybdate transport system ATP-binding protein